MLCSTPERMMLETSKLGETHRVAVDSKFNEQVLEGVTSYIRELSDHIPCHRAGAIGRNVIFHPKSP